MIGKLFRAPKGLDTLKANRPYYFLRSDSGRGRVLFVALDKRDETAHIECVPQSKVESALSEGHLLEVDGQAASPPWFPPRVWARLQTLTKAAGREDQSSSSTTDTLGRINARRGFIDRAVKDIDKILSSDDPQQTLNQYARKCTPVQHETRFRTWVLLYQLFGRQPAVLAPKMHRKGLYKRTAGIRKGSVFGRLDNDGHPCAFRMTRQMIAKISQSFVAEAAKNLNRQEVYANAMTKHFGCVPVNPDKPTDGIVHPRGKRFPSADQYWYQCEKEFKTDGIKKILRGKETYRNKDATPQGRYSERLTNVCERIHGDAEYIADAPSSYVSKEPLPPLAKVQLIDGLSGYCSGVGFSLGAETGQAYLDALFCMAVPKSLFGKLIGYPISDEEWPGHGVPSALVVDRGPGASPCTLERLQSLGIWRQMTPSSSPQSNSPVESRHDRHPKLSGRPTHQHSGLTLAKMIKREVQKTLQLNASSSAVNRASPEQLSRGVRTPYQLHTDMLKRLRCDAQQISVEDAVRTFLTPIEFTVSEGILKLNGRPYGGEVLQQSSFGQSLRKRSGAKPTGYALGVSTRYAWVEIAGQLIMVEALLPFGDGEDQLHLSLQELQDLGKGVAKLRTKQRKQKPAALVASAVRLQRHTGNAQTTPTLRSGPKRATSATSKRQAKTLRGH